MPRRNRAKPLSCLRFLLFKVFPFPDGLRRDATATFATVETLSLLEEIAKDPLAFILKQGWASVTLNGDHGLKELRSLHEHLQARILEMIETLDDLRTSADY